MLKFFVIIFVFINLISLSFSEVINKIDIKGNLRLDDNTIFSYINLNENSQILKSDLNTLFKDLFATEMFSEIKFEIESSKLIIIVTENPIINRIALEGNKRLEDEDILPEISVKTRDVFTAGYFNTTSAINAIQFKINTGNIDAGDICLYGIL